MEKTLLISFLLFSSGLLLAKQYPLQSPDAKLKITIEVEQKISCTIEFSDEVLVQLGQMALFLKGGDTIGMNEEVKEVYFEKNSCEYPCLIAAKFSNIQDDFNALTLEFNTPFSLEFRAYNDGFAYRFISKDTGELNIEDESFILDFSKETEVFFPEESSLISHNERLYPRLEVDKIEKDRFCSLPVLFNSQKNTKILFSESDLSDYPGLWLKKGDAASFESLFPKYPMKIIPKEGSEDRNETIVQTGDFIAQTKGNRTFPWRAFIIGSEKELIESTLIHRLAGSSKLEDTDWILPGQVAWDWYNANNIYGVDFESGINTATYKYYIDFAGNTGFHISFWMKVGPDQLPT
jgi:alpha-glucosidase